MCNPASCLHLILPPPRSTSGLPGYVPAHLSLAQAYEQKSFICKFCHHKIPITYRSIISPIPPVVSVFYYGLLLLSVALIYFSALMHSVILHFRTVLLLFCCTFSTALLFSYSAILITASVRNKHIVIVIVSKWW